MKDVSIDIETLGTNVESQIISIGACRFERGTGRISDEFYRIITIDKDETVNATLGTIEFWLSQANQSAAAVQVITESEGAVSMLAALSDLAMYINEDDIIWANGTKFDLGMLEYQYKKHNMQVPWRFNADRCMRTLRDIFSFDAVQIEHNDNYHNALSDAVWQAKYISTVLNNVKPF